MEPTATLPVVEFSLAKSTLSDLMSAVARDHQVRLVRRHRGKEWMALLNVEDVVELLGSYRFETTATVDESEVTINVQPLGVLGFGESLDEAMEDAVREVAVRAEAFFRDAAFYRKSERGRELPWLLRFALTSPAERVALLTGAPKDSASADRR